MERVAESMAKHGWWNKKCVHCGESCGGCLAEHMTPTREDLEYVVCPNCPQDPYHYHGGDHVILEFIPGDKDE